ncbi:hypothetical protein J6590_047537 [Homalodisca vitripennis]|nr:hypothetical protein J6590_047537 [Homalodisca vitripennis]
MIYRRYRKETDSALGYVIGGIEKRLIVALGYIIGGIEKRLIVALGYIIGGIEKRLIVALGYVISGIEKRLIVALGYIIGEYPRQLGDLCNNHNDWILNHNYNPGNWATRVYHSGQSALVDSPVVIITGSELGKFILTLKRARVDSAESPRWSECENL